MPKKRKRGFKPRPRQGRFFRLILGGGLLIGFLLIFAVFFNPLVWRLDLRKELEKSKVASTVYDRDGEAIATLYAKTRLWVSYREIPKALRDAFVATEDYRFFQHKGIDFRGIIRALYQDIKAGKKVQGGSTITQQLTKNLFFTHEKRFLRKVMEMAYAIRIEQQYTKEQILEFYLNSNYLGHGTWGVAGASQIYFGKPVNQLTISESALLAGLAKSPEYYSPFRNPKATLGRRNVVLQLMNQHGYLSVNQLEQARRTPLGTLDNPGVTYVGAHFVDYVIDVLKRETKYSENYIRTAGLKIYTTMGRDIQMAAERALQILPAAGTDQWGVTQPQGAIVVLNPDNGEILGLVGGRKFSSNQTNRAFQIYRQPGSAIKPFLYAAALEAGYRPETRMVDEPIEVNVNGAIWKPQNYDNKYRGWITLREALEESVNTIAVQLVQQLGTANVLALAKRMGLESLVAEGERNDNSPAPLALGGLTKGVTVLEQTAAYTAFSNEGIKSVPFGIFRAYNRNGTLIYRGQIRQEPVISRRTADWLSSMMDGVVTRGTGVRANIGVRAAGKTGTSNGNTNGWFIGYTKELLAGVWIGNDRPNEPLVVKGAPLGSGMASEIWGDLMKRVLAKTAVTRPSSPRL